MAKLKPVTGSTEKELFRGLLESIDTRFGTSSREHFHVYYPPDGYTQEDIKKAHQEYILNGGDPDTPFFIVKYESAKKSPPQEANVGDEGNIGDEDTPKNPKQIAQQRLDKTGFTDCLD